MTAAAHPAPEGPGLTLLEGFTASALTVDELWLLQVAVGGSAGQLEVEAYTRGLLRPDTHQHQILAQALNEHFLDHGLDHPVAYPTAGGG